VALQFGILGPLEVFDDGRPLEIRGAKQRLLLAVLLLRAGEVVSKDALIDALWDDNPPGTADKALQMHVSQLRKTLGHDVIETRPGGYRIDPFGLDLRRFERALAGTGPTAQETANGLREALGLWRGPPLADVDAASIRADVARLDDLRFRALEDRIAADLELGRHAAVVAELEALVAREPLRERPQAQLMLALYRSGRQADALAVYRAARRTLVDEMGLEPGRELRELETKVLAQDPALDPPAGPGQTVARGLVGRRREFGELAALLDGAMSGRGALALVGGEPGIGKSRLADAVARRAADRGATVLVGRCWEAGGAPPYWPWVQALDPYARGATQLQLGPEVDELAAILPALGGHPSVDGAESSRFRLFAAVAAFLRRAAQDRPLAIFLDDLHAADPPSLMLLRFIAGDLARLPLLVVGCYRDSEVGESLRETLADLSREDAAHRVALRGLAAPDIVRLLEDGAGRPLAAPVVERLLARSEGNPLFAVEAARLLASVDSAEGLPLPPGFRS